jgi:hypothetical protein
MKPFSFTSTKMQRFSIVLSEQIQHLHFELWILCRGKLDPLNILLENRDRKWGIFLSTLGVAQI